MSSSSPTTTTTTPERGSGGDNSSSHAAAALRDVDIVTPAKSDHDRVDVDYSVNNEEEEEEKDLAEIKDLQRALEYLISDKRQSSITTTNNDGQEKTEESSVTSTTAQHPNISDVDADDETLCQIPNLVNRTLVEHYSSSLTPTQSHKRRDIPYSAREKMTQLIIAVIVEFAEPYFVRITRRREEERRKLLLLHDKEQEPQKKKSKRRKGVEADDTDLSSKFRFEDRAVSWATQCLKILLQPSLSPSIYHNNNKGEEKVQDDLHIPELDALLAATGSNDGCKIEERMQQSLLLGMQARSMFMSSYIAGWHLKGST